MKLKVFTASWCSSCTALKPLLVKNNIEYEEISVDDPDNANYAKSIGIRGLPTIIKVTESAEIVGRIIGKITETQLRDFVQ